MSNTVNITFQTSAGKQFPVSARIGASLMETAVMNNVPGIEAECGGACICATCHVYCDHIAEDLLAAPKHDEEDMLDTVAAERRERSRLSCQIKVTDALEGALILVPAAQF